MVEIHLQTSVKLAGSCELHASVSLSTSMSVYSPHSVSRTPFGVPAIHESSYYIFNLRKTLDLLSIPWAKGLWEWKLHITEDQQRQSGQGWLPSFTISLHFCISYHPGFLILLQVQGHNLKIQNQFYPALLLYFQHTNFQSPHCNTANGSHSITLIS